MFHRFKTLLCCATLLAGAGVSGAALAAATPQAASGSASFTVMLPLRNRDALQALLAAQQDPASASFHKWLTPQEFGLRFGPSTAAMNRVVGELQARGFAVQIHTRSVSVTGDAAGVAAYLATPLAAMRTTSGHVRLASAAPLRAPSALAAEGAGIVGLSTVERHAMARSTGRIVGDNRFSPTGNYYYTDLKQAYAYPAHDSTITVGGTSVAYDGTGATIGVVISSDVLDSDIKSIFDHEHYSTTTGQPDPTLYARRTVNGGAPFTAGTENSFEASLDVQAELTGAPGAHVVLYNIPDLQDSNVIDGYTAVIDDNVVDAVSSSFGECELYYLAKYNGGFDFTPTLRYQSELYMQGNAQGITFLASSGDDSGKQCITTSYFKGKPGHYIAGVSTPAADPNVTAVGGTNVVTQYEPGTLASGYSTENAWLDQEADEDPFGFGAIVTGHVWGAGGGYSQLFPAPAYQSLVATGSTTQRALPDVGMQVGGCPGGATDYNPRLNVCNGKNLLKNGAGNTDRSDFTIYFGGGRYGVIGTSVSSPEFTGALAYLIERKGRQGNLNPYLYKLAAAQAAGGRRAFHTLIPGYNGVIPSNVSPTFNVSTGVGTPIVTELVGTPGVAAAGLPQTPSNP